MRKAKGISLRKSQIKSDCIPTKSEGNDLFNPDAISQILTLSNNINSTRVSDMVAVLTNKASVPLPLTSQASFMLDEQKSDEVLVVQAEVTELRVEINRLAREKSGIEEHIKELSKTRRHVLSETDQHHRSLDIFRAMAHEEVRKQIDARDSLTERQKAAGKLIPLLVATCLIFI